MFLPWLVLLNALVLAGVIGVGGPRRRPWMDALYASSLLCFAGLAIIQLLAIDDQIAPQTHRLLSMLIYQLTIFFVTSLLLSLYQRGWRFLYWVLSTQSLLGLALILLGAFSVWPRVDSLLILQVWKGLNIGFGVIVVALLTQVLWRRGRNWGLLLLLAAFAGLGVMVSDLMNMGYDALGVSWQQAMYSPILTVLWLRSTRRIGRRASVVEFRRQLAQDLHDGVGSHLSTIISGMDQSTLQGRITTQALQECLAELKLLIDSVEEDQSVTALLANLRYRMEPLLSYAGICMYWNLVDTEKFDQVRGPAARHVLRIAQESLANVVHHSQADEVRLTLCHMKVHDCLLLEVVDNGVGFHLGTVNSAQADASDWMCQSAAGQGKGMPGMWRRAQLLGGKLKIHPVLPQGTRVALCVPMRRLLKPLTLAH